MIPHTALLIGDLNALIHTYESLAKDGVPPTAKEIQTDAFQIKLEAPS